MLNRLSPSIALTTAAERTGELLGMRPGAIGCAIAAMICALGVVPAAAQDAAAPQAAAAQATSAPAPDSNAEDSAADVAASADAAPADADDADMDAQAVPPPPLTPEEAATLGHALTFDPTAPADGQAPRALRPRRLADAEALDISPSDKPDGSRSLAIKQPLLTSEWDARLGADVTLPAAPDRVRSGTPFARPAPDSGAAWASVGVGGFASLDARVDPGSDQGKLATTFKRSLPLGGRVSVTLQDSYSVTDSFSTAPGTSEIPMMATARASSPPPATADVWGSEKLVKFHVLGSGTTLGAGVSTASNDPVMHNTLSADQELYGPLHVTTALTDAGQPSASGSIKAALELRW